MTSIPTTADAADPVAAVAPEPSTAPAKGSPNVDAAPAPVMPGEPVRRALALVMAGLSLSRVEAEAAMGSVMDGEATSAQLAGLLVALRMRGETVDELVGFASAMRDRVIRVDAPEGAIDTCGTGGDAGGTFNISTAAALVVAAAGVPVAKHGNRAITSASGSSDVLEALGVPIRQSPEATGRALREDGFAFLFAPDYHPAMRHAGPTRREIGVRTAFNLIGPLSSPAGVRRQLVGCSEPGAAGRMAAALQALGVSRAFVVYGEGLDELPLDGSGVIYDVSPERIRRRTVRVERLGLRPAATSELRGGTPPENAAIIEALLRGAAGPRRDVVILNAGAALLVAGRARRLREGVELAARTIDSDAGGALLDRLRARAAAEPGRA